MKLYDKKDDFNFPIVNIHLYVTAFQQHLLYGVYISQLIQYSIAYGSYHDSIDNGLLLTKK
jgi:hypothetical protein